MRTLAVSYVAFVLSLLIPYLSFFRSEASREHAYIILTILNPTFI